MSSQNSEPRDARGEQAGTVPAQPTDRERQSEEPEFRLSNDPDPYPDTDVAQVRPPGRGVPEEDPDPPLSGQ